MVNPFNPSNPITNPQSSPITVQPPVGSYKLGGKTYVPAPSGGNYGGGGSSGGINPSMPISQTVPENTSLKDNTSPIIPVYNKNAKGEPYSIAYYKSTSGLPISDVDLLNYRNSINEQYQENTQSYEQQLANLRKQGLEPIEVSTKEGMTTTTSVTGIRDTTSNISYNLSNVNSLPREVQNKLINSGIAKVTSGEQKKQTYATPKSPSGTIEPAKTDILSRLNMLVKTGTLAGEQKGGELWNFINQPFQPLQASKEFLLSGNKYNIPYLDIGFGATGGSSLMPFGVKLAYSKTPTLPYRVIGEFIPTTPIEAFIFGGLGALGAGAAGRPAQIATSVLISGLSSKNLIQSTSPEEFIASSVGVVGGAAGLYEGVKGIQAAREAALFKKTPTTISGIRFNYGDKSYDLITGEKVLTPKIKYYSNFEGLTRFNPKTDLFITEDATAASMRIKQNLFSKAETTTTGDISGSGIIVGDIAKITANEDARARLITAEDLPNIIKSGGYAYNRLKTTTTEDIPNIIASSGKIFYEGTSTGKFKVIEGMNPLSMDYEAVLYGRGKIEPSLQAKEKILFSGIAKDFEPELNENTNKRFVDIISGQPTKERYYTASGKTSITAPIESIGRIRIIDIPTNEPMIQEPSESFLFKARRNFKTIENMPKGSPERILAEIELEEQQGDLIQIKRNKPQVFQKSDSSLIAAAKSIEQSMGKLLPETQRTPQLAAVSATYSPKTYPQSSYYGTGQYERTEGVSIARPASLINTGLSTNVVALQQQNQYNKLNSKLTQALINDTLTKQQPSQTQESSQDQLQEQLQLQALMTKQLQKQEQQSIELLAIPERTGMISTFSFYRGTKKKESRLKKVALYNVLVRKRRKYIPIGLNLPRQDAVARGSNFALNDIARTFKIVKSGKTQEVFNDFNENDYTTPNLRVFRNYQIKNRRQIPLSDTYIQKTRYNLQSTGEKAQIKEFRRQAIMMKKIGF